MLLNSEFANQLSSFLSGQLSLSAYREAMMRVRVEKLDSLEPRDQNFLYEFETRYAQLKASAITQDQFKLLLSYASVSSPASYNTPVPVDMWFRPDPPEEPVTGTNSAVDTGTYTNREPVYA